MTEFGIVGFYCRGVHIQTITEMPSWPSCILYMELIGIATMLLAYLPFVIKDLRTCYLRNRDNASRLESISK